MSKVLLDGLGGATFDIIDKLIEKARLPNLEKMQKEGTWGVLKSTIPPITPAAWTSLFTGKNPGKHGIFDFSELDPQTYERRPVYTDRHLEKTLWNLLDETGKRSIELDVPYTYPPKPLKGIMLTGFGIPRIPGIEFAFPNDLTKILAGYLHDQIKIAQPKNWFDRSPGFLNEWKAIMDGREKLIQYLMCEEEWDLFFNVFSITDNLAHVFWTFFEPQHPNYHTTEGPSFREALYFAYERCVLSLLRPVKASRL